MSQKDNEAKSYEPKPVTKSYGVKMLGVKVGKKSPTNKTRVFGSNINVNEPDVILNPVPLQMVVPVDISIDRSKSATTEKKKISEKVSTSEKDPFVHVHNPVESMNVAKEVDSNTTGKIINQFESTLEEPHVESHADPHVEPNVETFVPTSGEPYVNPPTKPIQEHSIETPIFDKYLDSILNENHESNENLRDEDPQNEERKDQGKRNEDDDENDDIPIANIMKRIIENFTKSQEKTANKEVVNIDEETETGEEPVVNVMRSITKFLASRVKDKK